MPDDASTQPTLSTPRLVLRPFAETDAPRVRLLAGAREVADTTLRIPHPYPEGAAESWIATHPATWASGEGVSYAIVERDGLALAGAVSLVIDAPERSAELGYWIGVDRWGRGYATEASRALLDLAFDTLGLHRIVARHLVRNPASGRVMQKLGMRFEGVQRGGAHKWGRPEDLAAYELLASDPRS